MGHANPFYTSMFQDLFKDIRNISIQLPFKNSKVHWDFNSQSKSAFGSVGVHSFTFTSTPGSMKCDSWADHSWPTPL
jgi:hypothetical protein